MILGVSNITISVFRVPRSLSPRSDFNSGTRNVPAKSILAPRVLFSGTRSRIISFS